MRKMATNQIFNAITTQITVANIELNKLIHFDSFYFWQRMFKSVIF